MRRPSISSNFSSIPSSTKPFCGPPVEMGEVRLDGIGIIVSGRHSLIERFRVSVIDFPPFFPIFSSTSPVRRWCLETMRVKATIDAHLGVSGGAYWVDGVGRNLFTQGRNGVLKRYLVVKAKSGPIKTSDGGDPKGSKNDNEGTVPSDSSDDDDDDLESTAEFSETINEEEDCGFCVSALTVNPRDNGDAGVDIDDDASDDIPPSSQSTDDVILAVPKAEGRVSIYFLPSHLGPIKKERKGERMRFSPSSDLKLGMCMTMAFATVDSSIIQLLVGYEDGSLVLWSAASNSLPPRVDHCQPLVRLKVFDSPVISLDFSPRVRVGFVGSAESILKKVVFAQLDDDENNGAGEKDGDASPILRLIDSDPKPGMDFAEKGVSSIRLRTHPDRPKLAVAGSWNALICVFTIGSMKPLAKLDLHRKTIRSIDFDAETGMMAVGSDDSHVSLWHLYCDKKNARL